MLSLQPCVVDNRAFVLGLDQMYREAMPVGRDPLSQAMLESRPHWSMLALTAAARASAEATDDISLVGIAAYLADPVVLTALRESVVLYAEMMVLGALHEPEIVWEVDRDLAERAGRFVRAYAALFGQEPPIRENAAHYWHAYQDSDILGRCVRLGFDDASAPILHYHWAIGPGADYELTAWEFWAPEVWTTDRYRVAIGTNERPDL